MKVLADRLTQALMILIFLIGIGSVQAFAEDNPASNQTPIQKVPQGLDRKAKIEALKKLKAENPEEFRRVVKERKEKIKEKLKELKEKDPEKYREVTKKIRERRKERFEKLRQENPEKFREIMRNKAEKLKDLKEKDPAKYEQFMKNHPHLAERLERREGERDEGLHRGEYQGVRDHGQGVGRGKGQGAVRRSGGPDGSNHD